MTKTNVVPFPTAPAPEPEPDTSGDWMEKFQEDDLPQFLYYVQCLTDATTEEEIRLRMSDIKMAVSTWVI